MAEGHAPERMLTDKNLVDISNNIGNEWDSLAVYLKTSQPQIDHIKADHRQSMQQQIYNMLLMWRNTEGCNATWTSLRDKMINVPGVEINWNALHDTFEPVVDSVIHKKSDDRQQTSSQVPIRISQFSHIPFPLPNVSQKLLAELQHDLINYYRELFCSLQISPLIEEVGYASSFLDLYVKPILTILNHQGAQEQSTPVRTFHDIFMRNSKHCKKIYVSSQAGCGKTSFAKYMTLIWCQAHQPIETDQWTLEEDVNEMRAFKFLFFVFLRDEHEQECDVDIMIQNQLLPKLANSTTYTELGLKFLQNLLSSLKCIVILDGLDEWSHPTRNMHPAGNTCMLKDKHIQHNKHIPHNKARPLCTTLTTSRPWKLDVVGLKHEDIDQKLELNGLEGDLLKRLIDKVVTRINKLQGKDRNALDFEQELRSKKLMYLCKFPVVVMQLLTVWFDNGKFGESQCEIYSNMIEFLLKHYFRKKEIVSEMEDIQVDDCSRDRQTPKCLQNNMYCKVYMELLSKLATLAYNTLFTDNEESSLEFDRRIAKKYLTDPEIEMSLAVGILTQEKVLGKMSIRQSHISFIHKTFQEYLAALYVALSPGMVTFVEKKIKRVCCSIEKFLEMLEIFMFLTGLCPKVMINLHEHLRQTVSEDNRTQKYRASCKLSPWSSEGKTLDRVQYTMKELLVESWLNEHKHFTHLPVSDFFIGWPGSRFKSLIVHNPVCSLSVIGVDYSPEQIKDILNSVTVFNSIQKLWLLGVSETFVVQLVSQHTHSLSVRPETWRHLGNVTFVRVRDGMSGDILCSLVDSILQLPTSVHVRLENCSIRQGTRDWEAYIRSHSRLTVHSYVHDDNRRRNVELLQFCTN